MVNMLAGCRLFCQESDDGKRSPRPCPLTEGDPLHEEISFIIGQTQRLEELVKDMLAFARPLAIEKIEADINELVGEVLKHWPRDMKSNWRLCSILVYPLSSWTVIVSKKRYYLW